MKKNEFFFFLFVKSLEIEKIVIRIRFLNPDPDISSTRLKCVFLWRKNEFFFFSVWKAEISCPDPDPDLKNRI